MNESNIIMFPKSPAALSADFKEIMQKFDADLSKIRDDDAMIRAALAGDNRAMAKASGDVTLAKMTKLRDAIWNFNRSYADHKRLEKRSERFLGGRQ